MWSWSLLLSTTVYKSYQTMKEPGWPSTPSLSPMQTFIMPKTFFLQFSFPLFTSLSLAGFCWDRKSRKVCGSLFEVFCEEFQPNFLSQRGFNSTTQPTHCLVLHKTVAPAPQDFWEQECMEKAALQTRGHVPRDETEQKLYWRAKARGRGGLPGRPRETKTRRLRKETLTERVKGKES